MSKPSETAAGILFDQGVSAHQSGNFSEARRCYEAVLAADPVNGDALFLLASLARQEKNLDTASSLIQKAVHLYPERSDFHHALGGIHSEAGQAEAAVSAYQRAIAIAPRNAQYWNDLGVALKSLNQLDEARSAFEIAVKLDIAYGAAHNNLGTVYFETGQLEAAERCYLKAIACDPYLLDGYNNLSILHMARGENDQCEDYLCHGLRINPQHDLLLNTFGNYLFKQSRLEEAIQVLMRALALNPRNPVIYKNISSSYYHLGIYDKALAYVKKSIVLDPDYAEGHYNHALLLLLQEKFEAGWEGHEWRWRWDAYKRDYPFYDEARRWDGCPRPGKRILVYTEQGLGDAIQFVRFVSMIPKMGMGVILYCHEALTSLFSTLQGVTVVSKEHPIPSHDLQAPILSLPYLLKVPPSQFSAKVPYLFVPPLKKHSEMPIDRPNVGLVWGGNPDQTNDTNRSIPFDELKPILDIREINFYSLQMGQHRQEMIQSPISARLQDLTPKIADLGDTAAAIAALDLIITVDTAVAHLAGAMNAPVWILLAFSADWRWQLNQKVSIWYPSANLFRQKKFRCWDTPINAVVQALSEWAPTLLSQKRNMEKIRIQH